MLVAPRTRIPSESFPTPVNKGRIKKQQRDKISAYMKKILKNSTELKIHQIDHNTTRIYFLAEKENEASPK